MSKILVLSSFPAPYRIDVFKGLANKYDMDLFFLTDADQNRSKEFFVSKDKFTYYVLAYPSDRLYFNKCVSNIKKYDLIVAYDWYLPFALKVELKCILKSIPYIINCDGGFITPVNDIRSRIKYFVKSFFIKRAEVCLSSGKYATEYYCFYGANRKNITEHPFSSQHDSDIAVCALSGEEKIELRKRLGLSERKCVVSVGQFIYRKGYDVLLKAWKQLDESYQLIIIGGGECKASYLDYINQNNMKNVTLLDFLPKRRVLEYIKAADVFVLPTREDIWGLVINESLSVGTPVITTDRCVAGLELISDNENGYIVPVDNEMELKNKISEILSFDKTRLEQFANAAIQKVRNYTIENIVKEHIKIIDLLVEKK